MNNIKSRRWFLSTTAVSGFVFFTMNAPSFASLQVVEKNWRYCASCGVLFSAGHGRGVCPKNPEGHDAAGFNFVVGYTDECMPDAPKYQSRWRTCNKCLAMFYNGEGTKVCPARGPHAREEGKCFYIPTNRLHAEVLNPENKFNQGAWRFCGRCGSLFYDGFLDNKGVCPVGGAHAALGDEFVLMHDT